MAPDKNDLKSERAEVASIMKQKFSGLKEDLLSTYLYHADMRIRQRAEIELANRGDRSYDLFKR